MYLYQGYTTIFALSSHCERVLWSFRTTPNSHPILALILIRIAIVALA